MIYYGRTIIDCRIVDDQRLILTGSNLIKVVCLGAYECKLECKSGLP
jgi:hypothetical protein